MYWFKPRYLLRFTSDLFTFKVKYLDQCIRSETLEIQLVMSKSLSQLRPPRTPMELRSFLCMCNFYRRFKHDYTTTERSLYDLLKGDIRKQLSAFME